MAFVFRIQKKSRITRRDSCKDTERSSVLETRKWYGTLLYTPEGKWDSTATQMVERFKDTGHPVFKSISAWSRGILKKKEWQRRRTLQCGCFDIHSVNQLSITEQFRIGVNNSA